MKNLKITVAPVFLTAVSLLSQVSFGGEVSKPDRENSDNRLESIISAVASLEKRIPSIITAGEETARRIIRNPYASIECPRKDQWGFSEEFWERAGGLSQFADGRYDTPDNTVLLSSRARDAEVGEGKFAVRFGPTTGDRGVDLIVDVVAGWMFCCEYYAACSRFTGRVPASTRSLGMKDCWISNCSGWSPDHLPRLVPSPERIPAGRMSRAYLDKALGMLKAMRRPATRDAVRAAAKYIVGELKAGRTVGVAGLGHPIIEECVTDLKSGMKGVVVVGHIPKAYTEAFKSGDTLVWLAYGGLDTYWGDYGTPMRAAGLNLVLSHRGMKPCTDHPFVKAFIPQLWDMPDAEIEIPVRPFRFAPLSEVSRCTLLRMLDAEVAKECPRPENPPPDYGRDFFATVDYAKKIPPPRTELREWSAKGFDFVMNRDFRWSLKGKTGFDYDMIRPLSERLLAYQKGLKYGLLSPGGEELTPPDRELIAPFGLYGMPEREYAIFAEGVKYGKLDPVTGKPLAEPLSEDYPR